MIQMPFPKLAQLFSHSLTHYLLHSYGAGTASLVGASELSRSQSDEDCDPSRGNGLVEAKGLVHSGN